MKQGTRVLGALLNNPASVPRSHVALTTPGPRDPSLSSDIFRNQVHTLYTYIYAGKMLVDINI